MAHLELKAVTSTTGMQIVASVAMMAMAAVAPLVARDIGVPASMIGDYVGLLYIASSLTAATCSSLLPKYGGIRFSQIALALIALGMLACCLQGLTTCALGGFLIGLGYGIMTPSSSDLLARYVPKKRIGLILSVKQSGVPLGFGLAGLLVPSLAHTLHWTVAFAVVASVCFLVLLFAATVRAELDQYADASIPFSMHAVIASIRLVATTPALRRVTIVSLVYNGVQLCVLSFLVSFLFEVRTFEIVAAGFALSLANAGGMFGRIFWGALSDRFQEPMHLLGMLGVVMAALTALLALLPMACPVWLVFLCCTVLGSIAVGWSGVALAVTARATRDCNVGTATGGTLFFSFMGSYLFPMFFAWLQRHTGSYSFCFLAVSGFCAVVSVWSLVTTKRPS